MTRKHRATRPVSDAATTRATVEMFQRAKMNGCELAFIAMEFLELSKLNGLDDMDGCDAWARVCANAEAWIAYIRGTGEMPT